MPHHAGKIALYLSRPEKWEISGFYALCITLFLMPFPRTFSLWTMGAFLFLGTILWVLRFKEVYSCFRKNLLIIIPPIAYFSLYLVHFIFGDRLWIYVEDKLMFLVVPLLGLPVFNSSYLRKNQRHLLLSPVLGIIIICIYQFSRTFLESFRVTNGTLSFEPFISPDISRFLWDQLSCFEHPSYLAIKTLWVITLLFLTREIMGFRWYQSLILTALLSIFIFFLSAKTELLLLGLLLAYFLYCRLKKSISTLTSLLITLLLLAGFIWAFTRNARVQGKLDEIKKRQTEGMVNWKDLDPRTRSWFYSFQLIRENPFLGIGLNARNILAEEYRKGGYTVDAELRLNSHNQYLETQMTLGLPGTLVLLWMLINPLIFRKQTLRPVLIFPFIFIISVSMITESILVRQWGIMFFIMFYCLLLLPIEADSNEISERRARISNS